MSEMQAGRRVNLLLLCLCASLYVAAPTDSVCGNEERLQWQSPANVSDTAFELGAGKSEFHAWGRGRDSRFFFGEFLPAIFERTIVLDEFDADSELQWIFTGEHGGFTVTVNQNEVSLHQRFYDSFAFNRINTDIARHPEWRTPATKAAYQNPLRAVTVTMDHKLGLSVALNGRAVLREDCLFDVSADIN